MTHRRGLDESAILPLIFWFYGSAYRAVQLPFVQRTNVPALGAAHAVIHGVSTCGTVLLFTCSHGMTSKGSVVYNIIITTFRVFATASSGAPVRGADVEGRSTSCGLKSLGKLRGGAGGYIKLTL
jgi:hypothetical protein